MTVRSFAGAMAAQIARGGPVPVAQFMAEANARYYAGRDPLGAAGDFITAPEISQMFGELVGLCLADGWARAGRPERVAYVELGPGRGTLARDALRAMASAGLAPEVHFVEASPVLAALQHAAVPGATVHADTSGLPDDRPLLLVTNEFFDALPVRQLVRTDAGWRERMVGIDGGRPVPMAGARPMDAAVPAAFADAAPGAILETSPAATAICGDLAARLAAQGGAGLVIDYGYAGPQLGSTLQAVRAHAHADPFADAGDADLTAHVDFAALADAARGEGVQVAGPVGQGAWLGALGIAARSAALARAVPGEAAALDTARRRLTDADAMGTLFKVLGLAAPGWPELAGF